RVATSDETVSSLRVPSLVEVNGGVFAVAEAQCTKDGSSFTGIASQILAKTADKEKKEELLKDAKNTQFLEEGDSTDRKKVDVSRPTTVVHGSDIYMLVGKYESKGATVCQVASEAPPWGLLLVRGNVSEGNDKKIHWNDTYHIPCMFTVEHHSSLGGLIGGGGSGIKMQDGTLVFPVEGTKKRRMEKGFAGPILAGYGDLEAVEGDVCRWLQ
ncbi:trans-sialidase, putative, partial [Trypanosoma cruzi marinkellei]